MMDLFDLLVSIFVFFLYGIIFVLSIIFTFWLELFHRKPPNRRISGLVPAICRYRNPSKAVAIYVF